MKQAMVRIGDFFFKWRNQAFPLIIIGAYVLIPPPIAFLGRPELEPWKDLVAILTVLAGLVLRSLVVGYKYIKRGGVNKKVYAADLVTSGIFGMCRNPLYVGNVLTYVGVFLMHGSLIIFLGGSVLFIFIYQCIIYAEERYLRDKFGEAYDAYCADVPRWNIRWSRFAESTAGMKYDLGKALIAEYTTIANAVVILAATEMYQQLHHNPQWTREIAVLTAIIVAAVVVAVATRIYKKSPGRLARLEAQK